MPHLKSKVLVVLTGGGTAGHVVPNLALLPSIRECGWQVVYIGSQGIEKGLIEETDVKFFEISSGKLRRYLSWKNVLDLWRILFGFFQSLILLQKLKPSVIFSKGGYVTVPVCAAGWLLRIPVVSHESDYSPGLATRINIRFSSRVLYSFEQTGRFLPKEKSVWVGSPVRRDIVTGDRLRGMKFCRFSDDDLRPILLVMGGSLGAVRLNEIISNTLPSLLQKYRVIHIAGRGKGREGEAKPSSYVGDYASFEYLDSELKDVLACTNMCLSRAGANSIFEFLTLNIPMLLVPLQAGSRGDQVENANCFQENGWALVATEAALARKNGLMEALDELECNIGKIRECQSKYQAIAVHADILSVLKEVKV